jgi:hypothetical protein
VQGRTYANMFGLVERFIGAKMLEITREHALGDQVAMEALVRFTDEELKHQELFRRIEALMAAVMAAGLRLRAAGQRGRRVRARQVDLGGAGPHLPHRIFTQVHYRQSVDPDADLSPLFKDVLFFHWREESQHAILDELEWRREDEKLSAEARDRAVDDLIALVGGVDGILQAQATADARYFASVCGRRLTDQEAAKTESLLLSAYRWQYIVSGAQDPASPTSSASWSRRPRCSASARRWRRWSRRRGGRHDRRVPGHRRVADRGRRRSLDDPHRPRRGLAHEHGSFVDHILVAGQAYTFDRPGTAIVTAQTDSRVTVLAPHEGPPPARIATVRRTLYVRPLRWMLPALLWPASWRRPVPIAC